MAIYYSDSVEFHMRQFIDLDPGLAADLEARGNTGRLVLVADRIMLSGAKFHNRDVILIANTVEAGVSGLPLELTRSGTAPAGVLIQEGLTHPETPVQGTPPGTGAKGHSLTVICRALLGGHAESRGQQGGKGLKGPRR